MNILLLEDNLDRVKAFRRGLIGSSLHHTDRVSQAVRLLETHAPFDVLLLDHDLDQYGGTYETHGDGRDFVRHLIAAASPRQRQTWLIYVHSLNAECGAIMVQELRRAGFTHVYREPWLWSDSMALEELAKDGTIVQPSKAETERILRKPKDEDL
jgi:CheY-like chemotaxis protein